MLVSSFFIATFAAMIHKNDNTLTWIFYIILCAGLTVLAGCTNHHDAKGDVKAAIATAKKDYQRGRDYDEGWQMRLAEHYYRKAYEGYCIDPAQDWFHYGDAGYRWAYLRYSRGDTEGALTVASELLRQIEENKSFPKVVEAGLLMLMADCQVQMKQIDEARRSWQKAYEAQQQANKDSQQADLPWVSMSISSSLFDMGDVKGAQEWLERCEQEFTLYEQQGTPKIIEEWKGHIALRRAMYLQASGQTAEAKAIYAAIPRTRIIEPNGYREAADYLMAAGRYNEAAYWYEQIDSTYLATDGAKMTFDNISSRFSPRYSAYRKAGRNNDALIIADSINSAIDSALVWQKKNDAAELVVIYQTHEKELALNEAQSETRVHRILLIAAVLIILLIGYLFLRARIYNKVLLDKNRRLVAEIEQREREEQQVIEQLKAEPEENLTTNQQLFRRICDLMDGPEHIYTDMDLDRYRLAQILGTNEHYVTDAISACCNGKSVNGFLSEYRLRYAAHLLATTTDSVAVIAEISGFSRSSFFRTFSDAYGMSPSEYRKVAVR